MRASTPRGVIVYLSRECDVPDLRLSLSLLERHFLRRYPYPIIIFHEGLTPASQETLLAATTAPLSFQQIEFQLPAAAKGQAIPVRSKTGHGIGYRHMCRFFSGEIYHHPALSDFEYYWRLDTDSYILGQIKYDVFSFMRKEGLIYGYLDIFRDEPAVIEGLGALTQEYARDNRLQTPTLNAAFHSGTYDGSAYYTNFEISEINFWRSKQYQDYFTRIDQSLGIYLHRWGDAPIHFLGVSMLLNPSRVHRFTNIPYKHQTFTCGAPASVLTVLTLRFRLARLLERLARRMLGRFHRPISGGM